MTRTATEQRHHRTYSGPGRITHSGRTVDRDHSKHTRMMLWPMAVERAPWWQVFRRK